MPNPSTLVSKSVKYMWAIRVQLNITELTLRRKLVPIFHTAWVFKIMPPAIATVIQNLFFFATSHHVCSPHTSSGVFLLCCSASGTSWFSHSTGSELTDKTRLDPSPWLSCSFSLVFSAVNNEENPTEKTSSLGTSNVRCLCSSFDRTYNSGQIHVKQRLCRKLQQRVGVTTLSAKSEVALYNYTYKRQTERGDCCLAAALSFKRVFRPWLQEKTFLKQQWESQ